MSDEVLNVADYFDDAEMGELLYWLDAHPKRTALDMWGSHLANQVRYYSAGFRLVDGCFQTIRYPEIYMHFSGVDKKPSSLDEIYSGEKLARTQAYFSHVWETGETHLSTRTPQIPEFSHLHHVRVLYAIYELDQVAAVMSLITPNNADLLHIKKSENMDMGEFPGVDRDAAFRVCREIYKNELLKKHPSSHELALDVDMPMRSLQRVVSALVYADMITTGHHPDDSRRSTYSLTKLGREKVTTKLRSNWA